MIFQFDGLEACGALDTPEDRVVGVCADFRLFVGAQVVYRDARFPVVELAVQLERWIDSLAERGESFDFVSRTSPTGALIRIVRGNEGWTLRSIQQELPNPTVFELHQVLSAARAFIQELDATLRSDHGFGLRSVELAHDPRSGDPRRPR